MFSEHLECKINPINRVLEVTCINGLVIISSSYDWSMKSRYSVSNYFIKLGKCKKSRYWVDNRNSGERGIGIVKLQCKMTV